jgi:hypothetical protein
MFLIKYRQYYKDSNGQSEKPQQNLYIIEKLLKDY